MSCMYHLYLPLPGWTDTHVIMSTNKRSWHQLTDRLKTLRTFPYLVTLEIQTLLSLSRHIKQICVMGIGKIITWCHPAHGCENTLIFKVHKTKTCVKSKQTSASLACRTTLYLVAKKHLCGYCHLQSLLLLSL